MKRDAVLQVRVTQEEKETIELLANEFVMKVSDYVRACAIVGPTPDKAEVHEIEKESWEPIEGSAAKDPSDFAVPDDTSRETFLRFLYERNTELHRDKQKRWPGVKARRKAGEDWRLVREGKPLEKIEPREMTEPIQVTPTTYRTA